MDFNTQSLFESGFTAEEMDLTANLLPIGEYVEDRSEMITQMLSSLRLPLLRCILPSSLKNEPLDKLKEILLHELSSIPKKDVLDVLAEKPGTYVPFSESVRKLEESVVQKIEAELNPATNNEEPSKEAPDLSLVKRSPKLDEDSRDRDALAAVRAASSPIFDEGPPGTAAVPNALSSLGSVSAGIKREPLPARDEDSREPLDFGQDDLVQQLLAEDLDAKSVSQLKLLEMRARIIRKMITKKQNEGGEGTSGPGAENPADMYDDATVFGDLDAEEAGRFAEIKQEVDSVMPEGFERKNVEGKVFRSRADEEAEVDDKEPFDEEDPEVDKEEGGKKSKHKRKKHRRHKKKKNKKHHEGGSGEEGESREKSDEPDVIKKEPAEDKGSEEGELESDEELDSLVNRLRQTEAEKARKLKQLEILRKIAPDEYYLRLREMQEEYGVFEGVEEAAAKAPSEEEEDEKDMSLPWNDPNYGKKQRRPPRPVEVYPPKNPLEVTNPLPDHPAYRFSLSSPSATPAPSEPSASAKKPEVDDEACYVKAVEDSLTVFESDLNRVETNVFNWARTPGEFASKLASLEEDLADVGKLLEIARAKTAGMDPQSPFHTELDGYEARMKAKAGGIDVLRKYLATGGKQEQEDEEEGEID